MRPMGTLRELSGEYKPIPWIGTVEPADARKKEH